MLSRGHLALGSLLTGAAASARWAIYEVLRLLEARQHGPYYLFRFR